MLLGDTTNGDPLLVCHCQYRFSFSLLFYCRRNPLLLGCWFWEEGQKEGLAYSVRNVKNSGANRLRERSKIRFGWQWRNIYQIWMLHFIDSDQS